MMIAAVGMLSVSGFVYGFAGSDDACPLEGTPECPKTECPLAGTEDCPYDSKTVKTVAKTEVLDCCKKK